ncbi:MAG: hypothetical protein ABI947_15370 [Chloroflexota bacterium]
MSTNVLRIIPTDPNYLPDSGIQQMAQALFSSFVAKADQVNVTASDEISFVDPGENWERVACPVCGADLGDWWQAAMEAAYADNFADLTVTVPCCGATGSFNDLIYDPAAGFARFILEAINPVNDVNGSQLGLLSATMRCDLRKIQARYE